MGKMNEGEAFLQGLLQTCAAVVSAAVALARLAWDLLKDRQQKSDRHFPKS